jgi:DNA mismatch endonuclease (patch repair protein)
MKEECTPLPPDDSTRRRMKAVRQYGTNHEDDLRRKLFAAGARYRLHLRREGTTIDIAFPGAKIAVFSDGCFWHGCPQHGTATKHNRQWWKQKLAINVERDERLRRSLAQAGWRVIRIWRHEKPEQAALRIVTLLRESR